MPERAASPGPRPLALIDVDGVLNPYAAATCPDGYAEHDMFPGEEPVRVNPGHGTLLRRLAGTFDLMWATSWEDEANRLLVPLLGLEPLPVIPCSVRGLGQHDKFPGIARAVGDRPAVWFDDLHSVPAHEWATGRTPWTLLIHVDPAVGLTGAHIETALAAAALRG